MAIGRSTGSSSSPLNQLAGRLEGEYASAKSANIERYNQALGIYDEILADYAPGGKFGAGYEEQLERTKTKDVGSEIQQNISSGLFGVQTTSGAASRWESEVGQPARLQLEDMRLGRYSQARLDKAGVIERREDEYPDMSLIASLYAQASQVVSGGAISDFSGGGGGGSGGGFTGRLSGGGPKPTPTPFSGGYSYTPPTSGTVFNADASGASPVVQASTRKYKPSPKGGTTGAFVLQPTKSEAATISSRLKEQYPQMFEPGWGETTSKYSAARGKLQSSAFQF